MQTLKTNDMQARFDRIMEPLARKLGILGAELSRATRAGARSVATHGTRRESEPVTVLIEDGLEAEVVEQELDAPDYIANASLLLGELHETDLLNMIDITERGIALALGSNQGHCSGWLELDLGPEFRMTLEKMELLKMVGARLHTLLLEIKENGTQS